MPKTIIAFDTETNESIVLHLDGNPTDDEIRKAVYVELIDFDEGDDVETMSAELIEDLYDTEGIYICSMFDGLHENELVHGEAELEESETN